MPENGAFSEEDAREAKALETLIREVLAHVDQYPELVERARYLAGALDGSGAVALIPLGG